MMGISVKAEQKENSFKYKRSEMVKSSIHLINPEKQQKRKKSEQLKFYGRELLMTE